MEDARYQKVKGVILMIVSSVMFTVMSALIKEVAHVSSYKTSFFRFMVGLALLSTGAMFGRIKLNFVHAPYLFCRGLFGGFAVFIFYLSIAKIGLGKGTVINHAYPIFASLIGAFVLKERIGFFKASSIFAAFIGIYLLTVEKGKGLSFLSTFGPYELIAVSGALLAGIAIVFVKLLHQTDSTYSIFFAQCLVGLWLMIIPANATKEDLSFHDAQILILIGLSATAAQLLMTEGFKYLSVSVGAILGMLIPVMNLFVGVIVYNEPVTGRSLIGSIIVIAACTAVLLKSEKPPVQVVAK